jgi:hypothetical protein
MSVSEEVLVKWYEARDTFLGLNCRRSNATRGLQLADEVANTIPEAAWLGNLFPSRRALSDHDVARVLMQRAETDPLAACYAVLGMYHTSETGARLRAAALLSRHPLYLGEYVKRRYLGVDAPITDLIALSTELDAQNEPRGTYVLALHAVHFHCDKAKGSALFERAAKLGFVEAYVHHGRRKGVTASEYWLWTGRAAQYGRDRSHYLDRVVVALRMFHENQLPSACLVQIWRNYTHEISLDTLRGLDATIADEIDALCRGWLAKARMAVDTWILAARRLRICKDMRRLIGQRVWNEWLRDVEYGPVRQKNVGE